MCRAPTSHPRFPHLDATLKAFGNPFLGLWLGAEVMEMLTCPEAQKTKARDCDQSQTPALPVWPPAWAVLAFGGKKILHTHKNALDILVSDCDYYNKLAKS